MPRDTSVSSCRVSPSASSYRQTQTRVASGARTAKLVASASWSAPSGQVRPGHTGAVSPRRLHVPGVTRDIVTDGRHNAGKTQAEERQRRGTMAEYVRLEVDR